MPRFITQFCKQLRKLCKLRMIYRETRRLLSFFLAVLLTIFVYTIRPLSNRRIL